MALAYAAQTRRDLKVLFHDLPWSPRSGERARRRWAFQKRAFYTHATVFTAVNGMLVGIWAATGSGEFWPAESIAGWGTGLGIHGMFAWLTRPRRDRGSHDFRPLPPRPPRALRR